MKPEKKRINCKAKGSAWEREIIKILEAQGFTCTRAAGSMGVWDIVADDCAGSVRIQAKRNCYPSKAERKKMEDYKCDAQKEIWCRYDGKPICVYVYDSCGWAEDVNLSFEANETWEELKHGKAK